MNVIAKKLQSLPATAGVYFFRDKKGQIIYIGKASILKRRVRSYFTATHKDQKTPLLVDNIADIDWIETSSEVDALFLEAEFIKRHKPLYNVREKDDKNFIFIRITMQEDFPAVSLVRRPADDKSRYFGPFVQSYGVRQALRHLRKVFPYFVKDNHKYSSKLEYQIGVLPSPDISRSDYRKQIRKLILVLEGKSTQLIDQLQKDIGKLSKARRYEEAAELRNQYLALKALNSRVIFGGEEKITIGVDSALFELAQILELKQPPRRIECYDISNFAGGDSVSSMVVFSDGLPDTKAYRHFKMRTRGPNDFAMMQETLTRRFSERNKAWPRPDLIIVDGGKGQLSSSKETLDSMGVAVLAVGLAKRFETLVVDSKDISPSARLRKDGDYYIFNFEANSALLHLLQRVRDEAHRFAVGYHTHVRNTRTKRSVLDGIDGVGPVTRKKLIRAFGSVAGIKQAPQAEIAKIVGNSKAQSIISQLQR
ncbi:excinuclease ABC subunit UvrC [Patescibacteria group bacterium]|nr:excinuclease ABC subunit UvrC [Patescibacteria group bacterium]